MSDNTLLPAFTQKVAVFQETVEKLRGELQEDLKPVLQELVSSKEGDGVKGIRWTQFTPYFNDGDPCLFGVRTVRVRLGSTAEDEGEYGDGYISWFDIKYGSTKVDEATTNLVSQIGEIVKSVPDDVMEAAFGDGVQVTVTAGSVDVEEYEHD